MDDDGIRTEPEETQNENPEKRKGKTEIDMISGPLFSGLFRFSLPVVLTGLLNLFYNAADLIVVGRFASNGAHAMTAVGSTGSLVSLIVSLFLGISVGASVSVAIALGAKDDGDASHLTHTSVALSLILGAGIGLIGFLFAPRFLSWMKCPPEIIGDASLYLRIFFCGAPGNMLYNFGASIMRTTGDTRRPLYILAGAGLANVLLNLLFVVGFSLSVAGVAIATITSQYLSAAAVVFCLCRYKNACRLDLKKIRLHRNQLSRILIRGVPSGIQSSLFAVSNVLIQSSINALGPVVMAGSTTASSIEGFVYVSQNAQAAASMTFVGQNVGARNLRRIPRVILFALLHVMIAWAIVSGATMLFHVPLMKLYLPNSPDSIAEGRVQLLLVGGTYFLCGFMEVFSGSLRGMGSSIAPTVTAVAAICGFRVAWISLVVPHSHKLLTLYLSYPISWILASAVYIPLIIIKLKRMKAGKTVVT